MTSIYLPFLQEPFVMAVWMVQFLHLPLDDALQSAGRKYKVGLNVSVQTPAFANEVSIWR